MHKPRKPEKYGDRVRAPVKTSNLTSIIRDSVLPRLRDQAESGEIEDKHENEDDFGSDRAAR
jgi:hypothetical protein